jgi:hypothetical protein
VHCYFENTQRGQIVVHKETTPDGSSQSFAFTTSYDGDGFSLTDGTYDESAMLVPGTYWAAETVPEGWDLTNSYCVDGVGAGSTPAAILLDAGETVHCYFENVQRGKIIVHKSTDPAGVGQRFQFVPDYDSPFDLGDGEHNESGWLAPATYAVYEVEPAGWELTNSYCVDGVGSGSTPGAIVLDPGETVNCYFENTGRGDLTITKHVNWGAEDPDANMTFVICITGPSYGPPGDCKTFGEAHGWTHSWANLIPGEYTISEQDPGMLWKVSIEPERINVVPGETAEAHVYNEKVYWAFTPGFWKNHWGNTELGHDHNAWVYTAYDPWTSSLCDDVFEAAGDYGLCGPMLQALSLRGGPGPVGAAEILLRAGTAAVLNASFHETFDASDHPAAEVTLDGKLINPDTGLVYYPYSSSKVIELVNAALWLGDRETMLDLAGELDGYNNGLGYMNWDWPIP